MNAKFIWAFIALIKDLRDFKVLKVLNPAARAFPP